MKMEGTKSPARKEWNETDAVQKERRRPDEVGRAEETTMDETRGATAMHCHLPVQFLSFPIQHPVQTPIHSMTWHKKHVQPARKVVTKENNPTRLSRVVFRHTTPSTKLPSAPCKMLHGQNYPSITTLCRSNIFKYAHSLKKWQKCGLCKNAMRVRNRYDSSL